MAMTDATTGLFEIVELPLIEKPLLKNGRIKCEEKFDKTSVCISWLFNKIWFSQYSFPVEAIFDNWSEFKIYFIHLLETYILVKEPTSIKNPQENRILEHTHQTLGNMLRTSELNMSDSVDPEDVEDLFDNEARALCSTHHIVLGSSQGSAIFGQDMMFNIPYRAGWTKVGEYRQVQAKSNTDRENN